MAQRYRLPAGATPPGPALTERLRDYFLRSWKGRILLAAIAVVLLSEAGLPLPCVFTGPAWVAVCVYAALYGSLALRWATRKLLWRIRTKLLVSYLFVAVVPLVLLGLFFLIAAALFAGLVAGHMVTAEIEHKAEALRHAAQTALLALPAESTPAALEARLAPARAVHPRVSFHLLREGRVLASSGDAPEALPSWWKGPDYAGLARLGDADDAKVLRAVATRGDTALVLDAPLDADLFREFEQRTGIHLLTVGGRVETRDDAHGVRVDVDERGARRIDEGREISGLPFFALPESTDWATGKTESEAVTFQYSPYDFVRRLSPARLDTADALVKAMAIVGAVFLVMYAFALLLGLLLARSVTRSVHALTVGTERVRQGDFTHRIPIRSRDQLGELAESFNVMARGIQDLLLEQAEKQRLEEELRIARTIQMSLLPQETVTVAGLRVAALCLPATEVGGDYYDLLPLSETRMAFVVADVSGKGTSAALYMAELKGLVLSLSRNCASPAKLLSEANRILAANLDSRSFVTMTYAVVDTQARTMRYARAGHNPVIHLEGGSGRTRVLAPPGLGLGIDPGDRFDEILEEAELPLRSGDVFLFFTDGLSEAMNPKAELFGERRLRDALEAAVAAGGDEGALKDRILAEVRAFVGEAAPHDDMTLVILKVV